MHDFKFSLYKVFTSIKMKFENTSGIRQLINLFVLFLILLPASCTKKSPSYGLIVAHRGASGLAPENTYAAIQKAIECKADMIEIDVHQTVDGALPVIHDYTVDRTTDGSGEVYGLMQDEISYVLDAGSWFNEYFKGEHIPRLGDVISLVKGKAKLLIELKGNSNKYPKLAELVTRKIQQKSAKDWCIIQSFDYDLLKKVHELDDEIELHYLYGADVKGLPFIIKTDKTPDYSFFTAVNINWKFAGRENIELLHSHNFKTFIWTVNDSLKIEELFKWGADGVITNFPNFKREVKN